MWILHSYTIECWTDSFADQHINFHCAPVCIYIYIKYVDWLSIILSVTSAQVTYACQSVTSGSTNGRISSVLSCLATSLPVLVSTAISTECQVRTSPPVPRACFTHLLRTSRSAPSQSLGLFFFAISITESSTPRWRGKLSTLSASCPTTNLSRSRNVGLESRRVWPPEGRGTVCTVLHVCPVKTRHHVLTFDSVKRNQYSMLTSGC